MAVVCRISARTLQRRLKCCGVEFEEMLDETRRSEAIRLIREGRHSMTEIAYRVGYSDPAHSRARSDVGQEWRHLDFQQIS